MDGTNQSGIGEDPTPNDADLAAIDLFKDIDPTQALPAEKVAEVLSIAKTLQFQKKHWRTKATDKPAPPNPLKPVPQANESAVTEGRVAALEQAEEKRQFGHANNLAPDETDHVFAHAAGSGMKPLEALNSPFIKAGLEAFRAAKQSDAARPGPSNRSPRVEGKSFGEMKREDRQKNFGAVVAGLTKK